MVRIGAELDSRSGFKLITAVPHQRFSQGIMAAVAEAKADHEKVRASITIGHSDHDGAQPQAHNRHGNSPEFKNGI